MIIRLPPDVRDAPIIPRIMFACLVAVFLATILSGYVVLRVLMGDARVLSGTGLSLVVVVLGYYATALVLGLFVGALLPIAKKLGPAVILGGATSAFGYALFARFMMPVDEWLRHFFVYLALGFAIGLFGTYYARSVFGFKKNNPT